MMDDDSSSNDSDNDDVKSETSNEIKPDSNDHDQNIYNGTHGLQNDNNNNNTGVLNSNGNLLIAWKNFKFAKIVVFPEGCFQGLQDVNRYNSIKELQLDIFYWPFFTYLFFETN